MTIDWTKPIETVDGHSVRVLATDLDSSFPVAVAVRNGGDGRETVLLLHSDGSYAKGKPPIIRNVPPAPIVRYFNVCENNYFSVGYNSRDEADEDAGSGRIACVRVEFREGQFDE